jgi:TRAP transporter TAXI family solute receptor
MFRTKKLGLIVVIVLALSILLVGCQTSSTSTNNNSHSTNESSPTNNSTESNNDFSSIKGDIRIGSASLGSTNQVLCTGFSQVVSKYVPGLRTSAITTQGSIENVRLLQQKELEFASINGDAAFAAYTGTGSFNEKIVNYQLFSSFNNQCVFVTMKDSGIKTIEDLEGKRVSVGPPGSGGLDLATSVLTGYGMWDKVDKVYLSYNDQVDALKDGTIDAMMAHLNGGYPASYFAELDATNNNIYIIGQSEEGLKKINELQPFQVTSTLKPGEDVRNLDREILAMTNYAVMYSRTDIPEDIVYAFVKTLFEHSEELDSYHRQGRNIRVENALKGLYSEIPVHPGAAKYFKEVGVWDDSFIIGEIK